METWDAIRARRNVRAYPGDAVPDEQLTRIVEAGWRAPSASHRQHWTSCSIEREIPAGDHDIVLLRVHDLDADPEVAPLVFHGSRYRRLHLGD